MDVVISFHHILVQGLSLIVMQSTVGDVADRWLFVFGILSDFHPRDRLAHRQLCWCVDVYVSHGPMIGELFWRP